MEKTYIIKGTPESNWVLMDASGQNLGRIATQIAHYLMGKHKPTYTPGVAMGDFVVLINAQEMSIDQKRLVTKMYHSVSGYPGGLRSSNLRDLLANKPEEVIRRAVWGMLPHNKMGKRLLKRLKVYGGSEHPHEAQKPQQVK